VESIASRINAQFFGVSLLAWGGWAVYPIVLSFAGDWGKTVMSQDNGDAKAFIADLVARSRAAQKQIEHYSQENS